MIDQFKKADIRVTFFDGVLVSGSDADRIAADEGVALGKFAKRLTLGELGCYFSHRRLWQQLIDSDDDAYVILEDDMILEAGFKVTVEALMRRGIEFDVVRLGPNVPRMRRHRYANLGDGRIVYWTKSTAWGTGAYTITKDAARALLQSTQTFWGAVDADIDRIWTHWKKVQMVYPVAARPMDLPSLIGDRVADSDRHISFHERWWRRGTRHLYRFIVLLQRLKAARNGVS
jgi:glycosyl transferase family 25